jgi:hypothetical protein
MRTRDVRDLMIKRLREDQNDGRESGGDIESGRDQKLESYRVLTVGRDELLLETSNRRLTRLGTAGRKRT